MFSNQFNVSIQTVPIDAVKLDPCVNAFDIEIDRPVRAFRRNLPFNIVDPICFTQFDIVCVFNLALAI